MKRSQRMAPVLKYEQFKEDQAAQTWSDAQMRLFQEQQKLQQLQEYVQGYHDEVGLVSGQATTALRIRNYHAFISRLNMAIEQQQQQVNLVQAEVQQLEQQWLQQYGSRKGMEKLVGKYQTAELIAEDKQEQKEQDELARHLPLF